MLYVVECYDDVRSWGWEPISYHLTADGAFDELVRIENARIVSCIDAENERVLKENEEYDLIQNVLIKVEAGEVSLPEGIIRILKAKHRPTPKIFKPNYTHYRVMRMENGNVC